jgi:hypothetical protein
MTGTVPVPGHVLQTTDPVLVTVLLFGMVVSTVLVAVGTVAWQRRRSLPYLLVTLALGTLAVKGVVGFSVLADLLPMATHHTIEHGLDLLMAVLLVGAVVFARERPNGELA